MLIIEWKHVTAFNFQWIFLSFVFLCVQNVPCAYSFNQIECGWALFVSSPRFELGDETYILKNWLIKSSLWWLKQYSEKHEKLVIFMVFSMLHDVVQYRIFWDFW